MRACLGKGSTFVVALLRPTLGRGAEVWHYVWHHVGQFCVAHGGAPARHSRGDVALQPLPRNRPAFLTMPGSRVRVPPLLLCKLLSIIVVGWCGSPVASRFTVRETLRAIPWPRNGEGAGMVSPYANSARSSVRCHRHSFHSPTWGPRRTGAGNFDFSKWCGIDCASADTASGPRRRTFSGFVGRCCITSDGTLATSMPLLSESFSRTLREWSRLPRPRKIRPSQRSPFSTPPCSGNRSSESTASLPRAGASMCRWS